MRDRHGNDTGEPLGFQILDELNLIKAAIAQHKGDTERVSEYRECLTKEVHRTLPCAGIPGAVPYIGHVASVYENEQGMA
ncbi:hypothetical protein ACFL0M_15870 [Thermodesulfobacteriota bacterium]